MADRWPTVDAALADAANRLAAVSDTPRLDAELLLAHALGLTRDGLLLDRRRLHVPAGFGALLARRCAQEPVAYILGYRDFWTVRLAVGPGVLIPRADSETLLEAACAHFGAAPPARIVDLGTGPGTLLLAALDQWPESTGVGVERSARARDFATRNAQDLGLAGRAAIVAGDWHDSASILALGRFDLLFANPPYVASGFALDPQVADHEPAEALFAGLDGLDDLRILVPLVPHLLRPGGIALIEIGFDQAAAVCALALAADCSAQVFTDLGGRDRAVLLRQG